MSSWFEKGKKWIRNYLHIGCRFHCSATNIDKSGVHLESRVQVKSLFANVVGERNPDHKIEYWTSSGLICIQIIEIFQAGLVRLQAGLVSWISLGSTKENMPHSVRQKFCFLCRTSLLPSWIYCLYCNHSYLGLASRAVNPKQ